MRHCLHFLSFLSFDFNVMTTSLFIWQSTPPIISQVKQSFHHKYTKRDVDEAYKKYSELVGFAEEKIIVFYIKLVVLAVFEFFKI